MFKAEKQGFYGLRHSILFITTMKKFRNTRLCLLRDHILSTNPTILYLLIGRSRDLIFFHTLRISCSECISSILKMLL